VLPLKLKNITRGSFQVDGDIQSKSFYPVHAWNDLLTKKATSNSEIWFERINDENGNSVDILNNSRNFEKLLATFRNTFGFEKLRSFDSR